MSKQYMELLCTLMLVVGLATSGLILVYRLLWRHRYGSTGIEGHFRRLRGRIVGPGEPGAVVVDHGGWGDRRILGGCFELELLGRGPEAAGSRCLVEPGGPLLIIRGGNVRVGDRVTVDAVDTTVRMDEAHYRHSALRQAAAALRIARGTWPRLAPLNLALVAAGALVLGGAALSPPPSPEPDGSQGLSCPSGAAVKGAAPPHGLLQWCQVEGEEGFPSAVQDQPKHGTWRAWWRGGELRQIGSYWMGRPNGDWTDYHPNGHVARRAYFDGGYREGIWTARRPDGRLRWRRGFSKGRRHGAWSDFDPEGRLLQRRLYVEGRPQGTWTSWYGAARAYRIRSRQGWNHGKRDGDWHRWHENGQLAERGAYRRGEKYGRWQVWNRRGTQLRAGSYRHGKRHGIWSFYDESGELTKLSGYVRGVPTRLKLVKRSI